MNILYFLSDRPSFFIRMYIFFGKWSSTTERLTSSSTRSLVIQSPSTSIFMILIAFFIRVLPLDLFLPRPRSLPPATRAASSCSLLRIGLFSHRTSSFCSWIFPFWLIECIDSFWNAIYSHVTLLITYPVFLTLILDSPVDLRRGSMLSSPIWQKLASPISFVGIR